MAEKNMPAMPEPEGVIVVGTQAMRAFTADQMHAYAKQYAEQQRSADLEAMRMALEALKVLTDEPTPAYVAISKADAAIKALEQRVGE